MNIIKLLSRANLLIALVAIVILFVLYGNKEMMNDWANIMGVKWIWVPIVIILFAALLYGRYFYKKKND